MKSNLWSKNTFFYETPLWGLSFIYHAQSSVEVLFWYGVVVTLTCLALNDMAKIVMQYSTRPFETTVSIGLNASNASLPDMEIVIKMPMLHLRPLQMELSAIIDRVPYIAYGDFDYSTSEWLWEEKYVPCINNFEVHREKNTSTLSRQPIVPQLKIVEQNPKFVHHDQWIEETKSFRTKMDDLLLGIDEHSSAGPIEIALKTREMLIKDSLISLKNVVLDLSDYKSAKGSPLDMMVILSMLLQDDPSVSNTTTNLNTNEVLKTIEDTLSSHIILESDTGKLYLRDWESDYIKSTHTLKYGLVDVQNVSKITIDIYSLHLSRILLIFQSIAEYITFRKKKDIRDYMETNAQTDFFWGYSDCSYEMNDHLLEQFQNLQQEYEQVHHASVQSSVGNIQLRPFHKNHIIFKTTGQLFSNTENCYSNKGRRECLDECIVDETLTACSCIPYWLNYLNGRNTTMCQTSCKMPSEGKCDQQCDIKMAQACKQSLMRVERSKDLLPNFYYHNDPEINQELPIVELHQPFISVTLSKTELINHPVYLKQYAMNSEDLIARLAGVAEFWIGLNVIALVHLVIFSVRCLLQDNHGILIIPFRDLLVQMKRLKQVKNSGRRNKLWFLSGNTFYERTPLTAFGFINQSIARWERNAWYCVLTVFIGLTIFNVTNTLDRYSVKETQTSPEMLFQMDGYSMPNFTVIIQTSYFDYFQFIRTSYENGDKRTLIDTDHEMEQAYEDIIYACQDHLTHTQQRFKKIGDRQTSDPILNLGSASDKYTLETLEMSTYNHLSQLQNWQDWISSIGTPLSDAASTYWANKKPQQPHSFVNVIHMDSEDHIYQDIYSTLIMLQSVKAGKEAYQWAWEQKIFPGLTNNKHHTDVPVNLLYTTINLYLKRMVGLSVGDFLLEDWFIDANKGIQRFSLHINLPTNTKDITIEVYSTNFARILIAFNSIIEHANNFFTQNCSFQHFRKKDAESCEQLLECRGNGNLAEALLFRELHHILVGNVFKHINNAFNVQLQIAGSDVHLAPFKQHALEMSATGKYVSHTQECYPGTLDDCISKCRLEEALQICDCVPWYLMFATTSTNQSKAICMQPCLLPVTTSCTQLCSAKVEHPCDTTMLQPELSASRAIKHIEWHNSKATVNYSLPLSIIDIKMKQKWKHPMFVEVYKMSKAQLMSELGALMEMWLGINVFALIHFITYLIFNTR